MLKILLSILLVLIIAGYFFIQWANQPKNVEALLKARIEAQRKAHLDSLQAIKNKKENQQELQQTIRKDAFNQQKTDNDLHLSINETFENHQFNNLIDSKASTTKIEKNQLVFSTIAYKKSSSSYVLGLTKQVFDNFVAEMDIELGGSKIDLGIVFNYQSQTKKTMIGELESWSGDQITTSGQILRTYLNGKSDYEKLVSIKEELTFKSIQKQRLKIRKKGNHLTISVNERIIINKPTANYRSPMGKIGIIATVSNSTDWNDNVVGIIKNLKIWTWQ
ncbi:hypothetical protein FHS57_001971 [Runella defluvii]|uniref:Uncharacterized protein n=1 Tax=Runella defluvii TaxID=370973 RepID=A0A7W6EPV3_9BACT|nr:hypothetical protein [Runella defluvii]MBB3837974.1 hypothetical protein [Runella defluvii]